VIAIIAILAAILFPVFARAREKARATTCMSNLRQLAQATLMYASDHDEHVPFYSWHYWEIIQSYVHSWDVCVCPSCPWNILPIRAAGWKGGTADQRLSGLPYALNAQGAFRSDMYWGAGIVMQRTSLWRQPAVLSMMMDGPRSSEYFYPGFSKYGVAYPGVAGPEKWGRWACPLDDSDPDPTGGGVWGWDMPLRHNGQANVAYCDGHVAPIRYDKGLWREDNVFLMNLAASSAW